MEAHGGKLSNSKGTSNMHQKGTGSTDKQVPNLREERQRPQRRGKECYICGKVGHFARECRQRENNHHTRGEKRIGAVCTHSELKQGPVVDNTVQRMLKLENGDSLPLVAGGCTIETLEGSRNLDIKKGFVGTNKVKVLRDTGCELAAVRKELVDDDQFQEKQIVIVTIDGEAKVVPTAKIKIDTPYYVGELEVMVPKTLICDLIIGNVPGGTDKPNPDGRESPEHTSVAAVMTRSQEKRSKQPMRPLEVAVPSTEKEIKPSELKEEQKKDTTLKKLWKFSQEGREMETKSRAQCRYEERRGVLYRLFKQKRGTGERELKQVVVLMPMRKRVMELAHESIVGGHLSAKKTFDRISNSFFWPGIDGDVKRYCRSCDMCQRMIPKGRIAKVHLGTMPIIEEPFRRMAMDSIGPISPTSDAEITMVDYATRYPEAVALPNIDTEKVAEAMLGVFSRDGFPSEMLSDNGTQFTSRMMKEVSRLISMKQLFTTPYNPKCNGLCERINGVLKTMLKKMCQERPKDWDRYLAAVLFAYREVPQASTGFSPFELLYGRAVRGPMQVLEELWTRKEASEVHNTYQYVLDLKHRLEETCKIAAENIQRAGRTYKHHYDKKARQRALTVGDKVLVLLPTDRNKMILQWKGPFEVTEKMNKMDYRVNMGNRTSLFHINLLKKYEDRIFRCCYYRS